MMEDKGSRKNRELTFSEVLNQQTTWTDYSEFIGEVPSILKKEVFENSKSEKKLIEELRTSDAFRNLTIKNVGQNLTEAENLLQEGKVVGVDGTMAKYQLLSGVRCQIGIVAVNYQGEKIRHSFFISQASLRDEAEEVLERIVQRAESDDNLSDMHLRGLMMYREREAGMNQRFEDKYILYHGPLLPFELMSGLGKLRALDITLNLLEKLVRSKRVASIISSTSYKDYLYFGLALDTNQYLTSPYYTLANHLTHNADFLKYANKWRADEKKRVEDFINDYASQIMIGVIKIGHRPYVFHAHKDIFDLAAAIIARDSMFQKEKGFPLLIDYADNLCSEYFSPSQFNQMIEWELAKNGVYLTEMGERSMRVK
ncbi:MAG: hypothetical protein ACYDAP_04215 [Thermoplasmataceae archaeon]